MLEPADRNPILNALRTHVALDAEVSDALTALHAREGAGLAELSSEVCELAERMDPSKEGRGSSLELGPWLGAILRGPHDSKWFDARLESGRQGWVDVPPLSSAVLIARARHRLTEMARASHEPTGGMGDRLANALGRLFDLEMAIIILDIEVGATALGKRGEDGPLRSTQREAVFAIGGALAVIETSAYLIGRYCSQDSPRLSDIERHVDRITRQVLRTKTELGQLFQGVTDVDPLRH